MKRQLVSVLTVVLGAIAIDANAQAIDATRWYRLRNAHLGDGQSIGTYSTGDNDPFMNASGPGAGQRWKLTALGGGDYRLTNDFLGECRALDTTSGVENRVVMGQTGDYSGQRWKLVSNGTGRFRLSNAFLGGTRALDTHSGTTNTLFMGNTGNFSGQQWSLTPLDAIIPNGIIPELDDKHALDPKGFVDKSEGPADHSIYLRAIGTRSIVMVFVDFLDAQGTKPTADVAKHLLGNGSAQAWYKDKSFGKMTLNVTRHDGYRRMPKSSKAYDFRNTDTHQAFLLDATKLFPGIDFSAYDVTMVVAAPNDAPGMQLSPAFNVGVGWGVRPPKGGEIRLAVTFGKDSYTNPFTNLVHELLHLHSLPDLYTSERFANVGAWDVMSDIFMSRALLGWHRHKLGWLDAQRKTYLRSGSTQLTLSPLDGNCGTSLVVVPIDNPSKPSKVYAIEIAQSFRGSDGTLSREGVLVYKVDATVNSGKGPVIVLPTTAGGSPTHGLVANAPKGVDDTFTEGKLTVRVLKKMGPQYRVQIDIAP